MEGTRLSTTKGKRRRRMVRLHVISRGVKQEKDRWAEMLVLDQKTGLHLIDVRNDVQKLPL
jgi:hypothetical protein